VYGTAKLDLPLDIDDFPAAGTHPAGDPRRPTEPEAAQLQDAEPVDLAGLLAGRVDQGDLAQDRVLGAIAQAATFCGRSRLGHPDVGARSARP
jgi:hypothetical protein